jgi:predicted amidohydrolase
MQTLRVAAVSMNGFLGEPEKSLASLARWCEQAAAQKADLALFPELVVHGHCTPNTWELAEPVPDGPSTARLAEFAKHYDMFLSVGLSEKENDLVYNTQVLVGPQGYIGKQRKLHLSRDEVLFYKGGRDFCVFDIGKCRVGAVICYDNQHPEIARTLALRGADVILMPHAARTKMWDDTPQSQAAARRWAYDYFARGYSMRARENACFTVFADQAGRAGYVDNYPREHHNQPHHCGGAFVWDPDGNLIAESQRDEIRDEMVVATLDPAALAAARSHPNYTLRTRRPELFGELAKDQVSC